MKKYYLSLIALFLCAFTFAQVNPQSKSVKPYVKKNGTYVQPHKRTVENKTNTDNYTTKPNVNPWNGKKGYKKPDSKTNYSPTKK